MNRTEHLLTCLAEECGEVAKNASKAMRFGVGDIEPGRQLTNAQRIVEELRDIVGVAEMLVDERVIPADWFPTHEQMREKADKVERFMIYARRQGALDAE